MTRLIITNRAERATRERISPTLSTLPDAAGDRLRRGAQRLRSRSPRNSDGSASSSSSSSGAPSPSRTTSTRAYSNSARDQGSASSVASATAPLVCVRRPGRDVLDCPELIGGDARRAEQRAFADRMREDAVDVDEPGLAVGVDGADIRLHHHVASLGQQTLDMRSCCRPGPTVRGIAMCSVPRRRSTVSQPA